MASTRKSAPAGKAPSAPKDKQKRGSSRVAERRVHTPEVAGSTPAPATSPLPSPSVRRARFVAEYLKDFHGTQAAIRAGYSPKAAAQQASRLLTDAKIREALRGAREQHAASQAAEVQALTLDAERTRREIARLAYFDPRKLFRPDGSPKPINELDDDTAAALAGMDVLEEYEGTGENRVFVGYTKKYKIADKNAALDKAAKIDGLFEKDNKQKVDPLLALLNGRKARTLGVNPNPAGDDD